MPFVFLRRGSSPQSGIRALVKIDKATRLDFLRHMYDTRMVKLNSFTFDLHDLSLVNLRYFSNFLNSELKRQIHF